MSDNLNLNPTSLNKLNECSADLQRLFKEVAKNRAFLVICGHRDEIAQNTAYSQGKSKEKWPTSKHNRYPSDAVDIAPIPLDYSDTDAFYALGGYVCGVADQLGIKIRWGANWDGGATMHKQAFNDLSHFELHDTLSE